MVTTDPRIRGLSATITSLAALAWFAWARDASGPARVLVEVLGVTALVVACLGLVFAASRYEKLPAPVDVGARRRALRISLCGAAPVLAGAGALAAIRDTAWLPPWLCAWLGFYFIASARVFAAGFLGLLGFLVMASALAAVVFGLNTAVAPGPVAGVGAGACLLLAALGSLAAAAVGRRRGARRLPSIPYD